MTANTDETCPVEKLIRNSPELQNSAIATWEGRSGNRLLRAVAALYEACPEACTRTDLWGQGMGDYYPSLLGFIGSVAAWRMEARTRAIPPRTVIDRRASMLGGAPWTCDLHPWPWGRAGNQPMSPLVQLNLPELDLSLLGSFPRVLVQVWGDEMDTWTRTIPLESIDGLDPAPMDSGPGDRNLVSPSAFLPEVGNPFLFYRGRRWRGGRIEQVGEYLSPGRMSFDLLGGSFGGDLFQWSIDPLETGSSRRAEKLAQAMARVEAAAMQLIRRSRRSGTTIHFGGAHDPAQDSYEPWGEGRRALLEVESTYSMPDEPDDGKDFGLCIFRDGGSLQVTFDTRDLETGYSAYASV